MSDFAQAGLIATLHRLNEAHLPRLETELTEIVRTRPIALVLPCHARDLQAPALAHIVEELSGAEFLSEVVLSLNGIAERDFDASILRPLRCRWRVLCNASEAGKGGNVAAAFALLSRAAECEIVATQDCDVISFCRADLARLCYAVAHPSLGYRFAKMYYSRVTDRLYGRVSRLFLSPLLQAVVRRSGHLPLVDFLLSFRYPLSGEIALTRELAAELPSTLGWGLEIAQLCEVFRRVDPREICQVGGGAGYDHKHQPATPALANMGREIARELFVQLHREGLPGGSVFHAEIADGYRREAGLALRRSAHLAQMNALPFDELSERAIVESFAAELDVLAACVEPRI